MFPEGAGGGESQLFFAGPLGQKVSATAEIRAWLHVSETENNDGRYKTGMPFSHMKVRAGKASLICQVIRHLASCQLAVGLSIRGSLCRSRGGLPSHPHSNQQDGRKRIETRSCICNHAHPIGQNSVTRPYLTARETGKCSFSYGLSWAQVEFI